jgi:hypothetical protein
MRELSSQYTEMLGQDTDQARGTPVPAPAKCAKTHSGLGLGPILGQDKGLGTVQFPKWAHSSITNSVHHKSHYQTLN